MKKKQIIALIAVMLVFVSLFSLSTSAIQGTTYTYTISVNGEWIRTQEAYIPSSVTLEGIELSSPSDLFIKGDIFYIADSGNGRVIAYNTKTAAVQIIGEETLTSPSGVFVDNSQIYVADISAEAIYIFDISGSLKQTILRPENTPVMSEQSSFRPKNVAVSTQGNIFVVGEGAFEGIMQFDKDGKFDGYFAANKRSMSFIELLQEKFFTKEQKEQLFSRIPRAIHNIDISERDLIYSVTQSDEVTANFAGMVTNTKTENSVKLHNMAGIDILSPNVFMDDEWNFVDIASGPYGNSFAVTNTGIIYEYDSEGQVIFSFGGAASNYDRYGLFSQATAIDLDENGFVYVLDKERGIVQCFIPTEFAALTHEAVYCFENGEYEKSKQLWEKLLQLNGMSKIAHIGYGKCLYREQEYDSAMYHFKLAGDKANYSESFWEIRNNWINNNILWIIAVALIIFAALIIRSFITRKNKKSRKKRSYILPERPSGIRGVLEDLRFSLTMLRYPVDNLYYLKHKKRGTLVSAAILLVLEYIAYLLDCYARGFIFSTGKENSVSIVMNSLLFLIPVALFVFGNYMLATIGDGEGSKKGIFIVSAYSLVPYMIASPLAVILSHILTNNEGFLFTIVLVIGIVWSGVLVFLGVMHIHNYTFKETVKNIILTLLFIILMLVIVAIMYMVWQRLMEFAGEFFGEVIYRAKN